MNKFLHILFLLTIGFTTKLYATVDFIESISAENIQIYTGQGIGGGIGSAIKRDQLLFILKDLLRNDDTDFVEIDLGIYKSYKTDRFFFYGLPYCMAYQQCSMLSNKGIPQKKNAIVLYVLTDSINLRDCLKLILYGLKHKEEIKRQQRIVLARPFISDRDNSIHLNPSDHLMDEALPFVRTISSKKIGEILQSPDEEIIARSLKYKYYKIWTNIWPDSLGKVDFYIQNDSFFLFNADNKQTEIEKKSPWHKSTKFLDDTTRNGICGFSNIENITSDKRNDYFIFTSQGAYYYQFNANKLTGPLTIPRNAFTQIYMIKGVSSISMGVLAINVESSRGFDYRVLYRRETKALVIDTNSFGSNWKLWIADRQHHDILNAEKVSLGDLFN